MKIRNGYVSNSSSSSFLVVLDKVPEENNVEEFIEEQLKKKLKDKYLKKECREK